MQKLKFTVAGAVLLAALAQGCAQLPDVEEQTGQSDTAIQTEMQVKTALMKAEDVWAATVRIERQQDAIHLQGFVASEAERMRILEVAQQAVPDLQVIDELQVWAPVQNS